MHVVPRLLKKTVLNHAAAAPAAASKNKCFRYKGGILTSSLMINIVISLDCSAKSLETDERAAYLLDGSGLEVSKRAKQTRRGFAGRPSIRVSEKSMPNVCRTRVHDGFRAARLQF